MADNQSKFTKTCWVLMAGAFLVLLICGSSFAAHYVINPATGQGIESGDLWVKIVEERVVSTSPGIKILGGNVEFDDALTLNMHCPEDYVFIDGWGAVDLSSGWENMVGLRCIRPNVSASDSMAGDPQATIDFVCGSRHARGVKVPGFTLVTERALVDACQQGKTSFNAWVRIQATCDATSYIDSGTVFGDGGMQKPETTVQVAIGLTCEDVPEAGTTKASVSPSLFHYECPEGFIIEATGRRVHESPKGEKHMCIRE